MHLRWSWHGVYLSSQLLTALLGVLLFGGTSAACDDDDSIS